MVAPFTLEPARAKLPDYSHTRLVKTELCLERPEFVAGWPQDADTMHEFRALVAIRPTPQRDYRHLRYHNRQRGSTNRLDHAKERYLVRLGIYGMPTCYDSKNMLGHCSHLSGSRRYLDAIVRNVDAQRSRAF